MNPHPQNVEAFAFKLSLFFYRLAICLMLTDDCFSAPVRAQFCVY